MKVSFSRKGFDSGYGRQPNVILPDGTLLVFPIPDESDGKDKYGELIFQGRALIDYIQELKPKSHLHEDNLCHLDPDLIRDLKERPKGWTPAFGQANQSLTELRNKQFGRGDLFLFFGWFKETEVFSGKLRYKKGAPDVQLIYGYLQVGDIIHNPDSLPEWLKTHPHSARILNNSKNDTIFLPTEKLSFMPILPGTSMLKFSSELVLTAPGMSRSRWRLPEFFNKISISHSPKQPESKEYFQSTPIGQEMIWDAEDNEEAINWLRSICSHIDY